MMRSRGRDHAPPPRLWETTLQTTHAAQEAAKIATSTQTTIVCKTGCDLRTPANEAIQQIGWDQAHLVIHMRSWN